MDNPAHSGLGNVGENGFMNFISDGIMVFFGEFGHIKSGPFKDLIKTVPIFHYVSKSLQDLMVCDG